MSGEELKNRVWVCDNCGTLLISRPLDGDTFCRIPSFYGCPICIMGTLKKQVMGDSHISIKLPIMESLAHTLYKVYNGGDL